MITFDMKTGIPPSGLPPWQNPANGLERAFLSEMLKHAGSRTNADPFAGAEGESPFSSMLNDTYAGLVATRIDLKLIRDGEAAR